MLKQLIALVAVWIFIAQNPAFAQNGAAITGSIQDADGKALDLVTVILFSTKDSAVVKTSFSEGNGSFEFTKLKAGNYFIRMSALGYENRAT